MYVCFIEDSIQPERLTFAFTGNYRGGMMSCWSDASSSQPVVRNLTSSKLRVTPPGPCFANRTSPRKIGQLPKQTIHFQVLKCWVFFRRPGTPKVNVQNKPAHSKMFKQFSVKQAKPKSQECNVFYTYRLIGLRSFVDKCYKALNPWGFSKRRSNIQVQEKGH